MLNEFALSSKVGVRIRERDIPISETVRGACEILGLDPLETSGRGACDACGRTVALTMPYGRCDCGGSLRLVAGEELRVKEMEIV